MATELENKAAALLNKKDGKEEKVPATGSAQSAMFAEDGDGDDYVAVPPPMSPEEVQRRMAAEAAQHMKDEPEKPVGGPTLASKPTANVPPEPYVPPEAENIPSSLDGNDGDLILGDENAKSTAELGTEGFSEETLILGNSAVNRANSLPEDARKSFLEDLVPTITDYKKELVTKYGFTPEEAMNAAFSRADKLAAEKVDAWRKDHPDAVILTIDKSQEKVLELTDEEKLRVQQARSLKLVLVEATELETLEVEPTHERVEMPVMREICGTLAQYSIPLLSFGDYATFRGAQSGVLATCTASRDDTMLDTLEKKATLLYNQFGSSMLIKKRKDDGSIMTYEDFCNLYHYEDVDMGVYAVVTASAMELTETMYVCQNRTCGRPYQISYNQKSLLDLSDIPDTFKARIDTIDAARSSLFHMQKVHEECCKSTRVKSPLTKNVYEIYTPTIAEARKLLDACQDSVDASTAMDLVLLLYVRFIWLYNPKTGKYFPPIDVIADPEYAFDVICSLHQVDLELVAKFIGETRYTPTFKIKTKCPYCGRDEVDELSVDNMVFLHARGTSTEIQ